MSVGDEQIDPNNIATDGVQAHLIDGAVLGDPDAAYVRISSLTMSVSCSAVADNVRESTGRGG